MEGGPPGFSQSSSDPPTYSGTSTTPRKITSLTGLSPSVAGRSRPLLLMSCRDARRTPYRPCNPASTWESVWALPLSLAATYGISFDFSSSRYLDVSVPWVGSDFSVTGLQPAGFPHSDIHGSKPACGSPWLFAACHVLPRLFAPRHPPCALTTLGQCPSITQSPHNHLHKLRASICHCLTSYALTLHLAFLALDSAAHSPDKQKACFFLDSIPKFSKSNPLARHSVSRRYYFIRAEPLKITKSASSSTPFSRSGPPFPEQARHGSRGPSQDIEFSISNPSNLLR